MQQTGIIKGTAPQYIRTTKIKVAAWADQKLMLNSGPS